MNVQKIYYGFLLICIYGLIKEDPLFVSGIDADYEKCMDFDGFATYLSEFFEKTDQKSKDEECRIRFLSMAENKTSSLSSITSNNFASYKWHYHEGSCFFFIKDSTANFDRTLKKCTQYTNITRMIYFNSIDEYRNIVAKARSLLHSDNMDYYFGMIYSVQNKTWEWINNKDKVSNQFIKEFGLEVDPKWTKNAAVYLKFDVEANETLIQASTVTGDPKYAICRYTLNSCHKNNQCGSNGKCVDHFLKDGFSCCCRILYSGKYCEKWSKQGIQMIICVSLVIWAFAIVIFVRIGEIIVKRVKRSKKNKKESKNPKKMFKYSSVNYDNLKGFNITFQESLFKFIKQRPKHLILLVVSFLCSFLILFGSSYAHTKFKALPSNTSFILNITSKQAKQFVCSFRDNFAEDYILVFFTIPLTFILYLWNGLKTKSEHKSECPYYKEFVLNKKSKRQKSVAKMETSEDGVVIITEGESVKQKKDSTCSKIAKRLGLNQVKKLFFYLLLCSCGFEIPIPMNPFSKKNRLITCFIFAAYIYNISKIFEFSFFGEESLRRNLNVTFNIERSKSFLSKLSNQSSYMRKIKEYEYFQKAKNHTTNFTNSLNKTLDEQNRQRFLDTIDHPAMYFSSLQSNLKEGILFNLVIKTFNVLIIGMHFYPILLCLEFRLKSMLNYFLCSLYIWGMFIYYLFMDIICKGNENYGVFDLIKNLIKIFFQTQNFPNPFQNMTKAVKNATKIDNEIFKKAMFENFFFYYVLFLIGLLLTCETVIIGAKRSYKFYRALFCCESTFDKYKYNQVEDSEYLIGSIKNEMKYTTRLLSKENRRPISYLKYLYQNYIYENRKFYRFSKQYVSTIMILFVLLYYISSVLLRSTSLIIEICLGLLVLLVDTIFDSITKVDQFNPFERFRSNIHSFDESVFYHLKQIMTLACLITSGVYVIQIFLSVKNYHKHVLNAYKGVYDGIPSPKQFRNARIISGSFHYSGYSIGYLLWGYYALFIVMIVIVSIGKVIFINRWVAENLAKIVLPIVTIYFFKRALIWYVTEFFLSNSSRHTLVLRNKKLFLIINHFNFFFDCFLMSFACFIRVVIAAVTALFYMPRLDYSIFGRYLERSDMGFISFVAFLHMEVNQTHPVKLTFCELLLRSIRPDTDNRDKNDPINKVSDENITEEDKLRRKQVRTRWKVAYTLVNNPKLKRERKNFEGYTEKLRIETLGHFLKRHFRTKILKKDSTIRNKNNEKETKDANQVINVTPSAPVIDMENIKRPIGFDVIDDGNDIAFIDNQQDTLDNNVYSNEFEITPSPYGFKDDISDNEKEGEYANADEFIKFK